MKAKFGGAVRPKKSSPRHLHELRLCNPCGPSYCSWTAEEKVLSPISRLLIYDRIGIRPVLRWQKIGVLNTATRRIVVNISLIRRLPATLSREVSTSHCGI